MNSIFVSSLRADCLDQTGVRRPTFMRCRHHRPQNDDHTTRVTDDGHRRRPQTTSTDTVHRFFPQTTFRRRPQTTSALHAHERRPRMTSTDDVRKRRPQNDVRRRRPQTTLTVRRSQDGQHVHLQLPVVWIRSTSVLGQLNQ